MLKNFFSSLLNCELNYSDEFKSRDFVHLYDFQKYYLHKSIRRLMGFIKAKQYHYWNEKKDVGQWQRLGKNIDIIIFEY